MRYGAEIHMIFKNNNFIRLCIGLNILLFSFFVEIAFNFTIIVLITFIFLFIFDRASLKWIRDVLENRENTP